PNPARGIKEVFAVVRCRRCKRIRRPARPCSTDGCGRAFPQKRLGADGALARTSQTPVLAFRLSLHNLSGWRETKSFAAGTRGKPSRAIILSRTHTSKSSPIRCEHRQAQNPAPGQL